MLTVRIQVIDGTGTFTLSDSQPCRLLTSLHRHYPASSVLRTSPPPQGARPVPHGRPVDHPRSRTGASRVACAFLVYMLPPLPRCSGRAYSSLISPSRVSLPRFHVRIGLHIVLFEVCSAFTRVAACTLARSPYVVTAIRRLQTLRLLHACSGRFRLERSPGGACTHWKSAALSRRTWKPEVRSAWSQPLRRATRSPRRRVFSLCPADRCETRPRIKGIGRLAPGDNGFGHLLKLLPRRPTLRQCQFSEHAAQPYQVVLRDPACLLNRAGRRSHFRDQIA